MSSNPRQSKRAKPNPKPIAEPKSNPKSKPKSDSKKRKRIRKRKPDPLEINDDDDEEFELFRTESDATVPAEEWTKKRDEPFSPSKDN